jgi:MtN3 and saliva related transmembrane protein
MEMALPLVVGLVAGCLSTYSLVPQVVKCWRTGETAAISLRMFSVRTLGLSLWTAYGFAVGSLPVLVFSALSLVLSSTILLLKVRGARGTCLPET